MRSLRGMHVRGVSKKHAVESNYHVSMQTCSGIQRQQLKATIARYTSDTNTNLVHGDHLQGSARCRSSDTHDVTRYRRV